MMGHDGGGGGVETGERESGRSAVQWDYEYIHMAIGHLHNSSLFYACCSCDTILNRFCVRKLFFFLLFVQRDGERRGGWRGGFAACLYVSFGGAREEKRMGGRDGGYILRSDVEVN